MMHGTFQWTSQHWPLSVLLRDEGMKLFELTPVGLGDVERLKTSLLAEAKKDDVPEVVEKRGDGWPIPKNGLRKALQTMRLHPF